jgi:hypothetical protein
MCTCEFQCQKYLSLCTQLVWQELWKMSMIPNSPPHNLQMSSPWLYSCIVLYCIASGEDADAFCKSNEWHCMLICMLTGDMPSPNTLTQSHATDRYPKFHDQAIQMLLY